MPPPLRICICEGCITSDKRGIAGVNVICSIDRQTNRFVDFFHTELYPDYGEIVRLVEDIEALHTHQNMVSLPTIQYYYAFALNRRNGKGDREKALKVINEVRTPQ
ncbi:unnamed protein product [Dibothriocephalus latus]|uniref:MAP3K TRAFs-binding domain-containing protein n=1 Tax=Dibothriocephalus latus TaxID=60516 RepID=A0A3P7PDI3_DIBLA|nr:unnamed protein product [Dibothriocephalus latus]